MTRLRAFTSTDDIDRDPTACDLAEIDADWPDALLTAELAQVQAMSKLAEDPDSVTAQHWLHVCAIWTGIVREEHAERGSGAVVLDCATTRVREVAAA